jgi:starvation-inducible outer membrane lipoprotein
MITQPTKEQKMRKLALVAVAGLALSGCATGQAALGSAANTVQTATGVVTAAAPAIVTDVAGIGGAVVGLINAFATALGPITSVVAHI